MKSILKYLNRLTSILAFFMALIITMLFGTSFKALFIPADFNLSFINQKINWYNAHLFY